MNKITAKYRKVMHSFDNNPAPTKEEMLEVIGLWYKDLTDEEKKLENTVPGSSLTNHFYAVPIFKALVMELELHVNQMRSLVAQDAYQVVINGSVILCSVALQQAETNLRFMKEAFEKYKQTIKDQKNDINNTNNTNNTNN